MARPTPAGTLFLVMGAPGAGTSTVVERVKETLSDMPLYNFPVTVGTKEGAPGVEVVTPEEFQRRKVSGELQTHWRGADEGEYGYRSCLNAIEQGKNVIIKIPPSIIAQVEKQFFFHSVRIVYITAPVEARKQRRADKKAAEPVAKNEKPMGPNVTTVVNNGTIAEGAAEVIGAIKSHAREVITFPPANITLPVMRSAQQGTRDYLTEEVMPGLQRAIKALSQLAEKPRNPHLWIAEYLETNDPSKTGGTMGAGGRTDLGPSILTDGDVVRADPVAHVLDAPEDIQGVANFRRSKKYPRLYGVHQATAQGIRAVVEQLCAEHGSLVWVCLRDTPVVYVNGTSYSLKRKEKPLEDSLSVQQACVSTGAEMSHLERRVARDLITRANAAGGKLDLLSADSDKSEETAVGQDGICTFGGIMDDLEAEGFKCQLSRCLFCKDGPPEPEEIDQLVAAVRGAGDKAAIVFQCESGTDRTSVGMTLGSLMYAIDAAAKPRGYVDPPQGPDVPDLTDKAQYAGIVELCKALPEGSLCKALVDDAIDDNDQLGNFRTMIAAAAKCGEEADQLTRSKAICLGMDHLERYWHLVAFGAYLRSQVSDKFQISYSAWLRNKRGIRRSLHKLCLLA